MPFLAWFLNIDTSRHRFKSSRQRPHWSVAYPLRTPCLNLPYSTTNKISLIFGSYIFLEYPNSQKAFSICDFAFLQLGKTFIYSGWINVFLYTDVKERWLVSNLSHVSCIEEKKLNCMLRFAHHLNDLCGRLIVTCRSFLNCRQSSEFIPDISLRPMPFGICSIERRWSSRRFPYGYLVTTSSQLPTTP